MFADKPSAVFIDIDNTLTVKAGEVPEENIIAISEARKAGHKVFINTGRSYGNVPENLFDDLQVDGWITGSGTNIRVGSEILKQEYIDNSLCRNICEFCLSRAEIWCIFECDNYSCMVTGGTRTSQNGLPVISSLNDFDMMTDASKVEVIAVGPEVPLDFYEKFGSQLHIVQFTTYADCILKGCNKAVAIEQVLEYEGIPRERSIAIGDSGNDLEMLQFCAISVAMGNAENRVKEISNYHTLTNAEFGVAHALRDILHLQY